jgi:hypothetical protein
VVKTAKCVGAGKSTQGQLLYFIDAFHLTILPPLAVIFGAIPYISSYGKDDINISLISIFFMKSDKNILHTFAMIIFSFICMKDLDNSRKSAVYKIQLYNIDYRLHFWKGR